MIDHMWETNTEKGRAFQTPNFAIFCGFCGRFGGNENRPFSVLHVNTVDRYMVAMLMRLADEFARAAPFKGVVEIDESYFVAPEKQLKCLCIAVYV